MSRKLYPIGELSEEQVRELFNAGVFLLQSMPSWFHQLPATVKNCAILDMAQRAQFKVQMEALKSTGWSHTDAKAAIIPEPEGSPYLEVFLATRGKPFQLNYGSASAAASRANVEFQERKCLVNCLLGINDSNGGGPGVMCLNSKSHHDSEIVVKRNNIKRRGDTVVSQVLLHIKKEHPNGYGTPGYVVWPCDSLMFRTNALLTIGEILSICISIGGFGTLEEVFRTAVDNQLQEHIHTTVQHLVPVVFLDYARTDGGFYWDHFRSHIESLVVDGCIRPENAACFHYLNIEESDAVEQLTRLQDGVAKSLLGYSLVEEFETANHATVFEVADQLLPELHSLGDIVPFERKVGNGH